MSEALGLAADRELLGRTSTAERVAGILRTRISEGYFRPGDRLSEKEIGDALGVSRNTLREAFRLLTHEGLLQHELNRGVFVRVLSVDDVVDLYRIRKIIECAAVRAFAGTAADLRALSAAVEEGERAAADQRWRDLGTANIHYHQAIAALNRSPRVDGVMQGVFAELRMVFHVMVDPRRFHEPYLDRNRDLLALLTAGRTEEAERVLATYLDDAEKQLMDAYAPPA
ncbi:GntR family transcriptional regulator [Fodinicola acaciae]|uniref:GntR family transcriptional regulator n=1 Tax=Fodinicola acaciae TaxID=2681555 RepID=UPI0013D5CD48|nr:GntR family transcriptional regulator [Fodinicola acaciae]